MSQINVPGLSNVFVKSIINSIKNDPGSVPSSRNVIFSDSIPKPPVSEDLPIITLEPVIPTN